MFDANMIIGPALFALSITLLGIALFVGVTNRRRPSLWVDLFMMSIVAVSILQAVAAERGWYAFLILEYYLAFVPARYSTGIEPTWMPLALASYLWTPFTSSLLHANALHLFGNGIGLFIFGRAVAWRIGGKGFLALFFLSAAAGALLHFAFHFFDPTPSIGASGGVLGVMGATFRFVPRADDQLKALFWPERHLRALPVYTVREVLSVGRCLKYVLICFLIYPLGIFAYLVGTSGDVAVMAHLGGFAFGFFGIAYFDKRIPASSLYGIPEIESKKKSESRPMKVLRGLAVLMMIVGTVMGLFGYYLATLAVWFDQ